MGTFIDLAGRKFGRLTVIQRDITKHGDVIFWECECECGTLKSIAGANLRSGHIKSCGCLRNETEARRFLIHNQVKKENKRLYSILKSMKSRCYSTKNKAYKNYGGRGIQICDSWLGDNGLANFVQWALSNGYKDNLTIDRIDVDGDYTESNCRWVTYKENQNNRKNNRYIQYNGETKTLAQWAEMYGLRQCELKRRLDFLQLPIGLALTMKAKPKTEYNGRMICISSLAQRNHINYKDFLIDVFANGKSASEVIREKGQKSE